MTRERSDRSTTGEITGRTRLLALVADPVAQARSPAMANALLARHDRFGDFALLPLQVPAGALDAVVAGLRCIENFAGMIVSMPHKTAIAALLDELTPAARAVGAVNAVVREPSGRLRGTILDGEGFVGGLRGAGYDVRGARCLLVGAGGAASAVGIALAAHGCASLVIVNRTAAKAEALAVRVRTASPTVEVRVGDDAAARYDLAVNGTSLGMRPDDALPMSADVIARSALVAECVLAPEMTRLLDTARAAGKRIHTGVPMLEAQMALMLGFLGAL